MRLQLDRSPVSFQRFRKSPCGVQHDSAVVHHLRGVRYDREHLVVAAKRVVQPSKRLQNDRAAVQKVRIARLDRKSALDQCGGMIEIAALILDDREEIVSVRV